MITVGIDLASQAKKTGIATIEWHDDRAHLLWAAPRATDDHVADAIRSSDKAGIDCPLGWPDEFVDFVVDHRHHSLKASGHDPDWWRRLDLRMTDRVVQATTGSRPLSVSTNWIAYLTLRCGALLARLAEAEQFDGDRSGYGRVVEVYPRISLATWRPPIDGYRKSDAAHRAEVVRWLGAEVPLDLGDFRETCLRSHDVLDAVIAALTARAAATGRVTRPCEKHQIVQARREGWIAVPTCRLRELVSA